MNVTEPFSTALGVAVFGGMLAIAAILSRTGRIGIPVAVLFLVLGMLAGSEALGGLHFADYGLAFRVGTIALALILFDGGLNTSMAVVRRVAAPAGVLATVGVAGTAALVAVAARVLGFGWAEALLLGAVVSSTDAAAVFSVLRGAGVQIKQRVRSTLELESGLNDPMAVLLTLAVTESIITGGGFQLRVIAMVPVQLAVGGAFGVLFGLFGRWVLRRLQPLTGGLFPVLTLSIACLAFGVPTLLWGSGFLAVYVAGVVMGNGPLPYRSAILRVHDFLAWLFQVVMFLTLGLLVFPTDLLGVAPVGLAIAGFLALIGRPLVVSACLLPFGYARREIAYVGWMGLRGAIPIILAAFPVLAGVEGSVRLFNVVFFVVVVSALIQGGSVRWVTPLLRVKADVPPSPRAVVEIASAQPLREDLLTFYIQPASAVCGATIAELPFPRDAAVMLIVRRDQLVAPRGHTRLEAGDHVHVFCRPEDEALLKLLFGQQPDE
jgi:potassium/hydrogen antiporter